MKTLISLLLAACFALAGCATNPVTGKQDFALVSEAEEIDQGQQFHQSILDQYGYYDDPVLQAYVDRIGQKLASGSHRSHLKFEFTVLDSPDVNAFALPGGYIYITRGIMAYLDSEAELAGVLGHEIGHVTARHSVRQQSGQVATGILGVLITAVTGQQALGNLSQTIGTGIVRGYGRDHELEADRLGAEYLHLSGYDPESMLDVIGVLKDQEVYEKAQASKEGREANIYHGVFSTHPRNDDRLKTVVRAAKKLSVKTYQDDNQAAYFGAIDGMLWGPGTRQGIIDGSRFIHPDLRFALQLPANWKIDNYPEFLQAKNPQNGALVQIGLVTRKQDESLQDLLRRVSKEDDLEVRDQGYGVTAEVRVKPPGGQYQPARISAIQLNPRQALTLMGTADDNNFDLSEPHFVAIDRSFTRLSASQVEALALPRLYIIERKIHHSFDALARQSSLGEGAEDRLRLLNRAFPNGAIGDLAKIKIVTRDD